MAVPLIACQDLSYVYRRGTPMEAVALQGVTLEVHDGEVLGLIGPTGSGKSTLVQHFNGLLRPTGGVVRIAGGDLWDPRADRRGARAQIGLVFQFPEYQLFEETVRRDVAYGPRALGLPEAEVTRRVEEALRQVGLDPARVGDRSPFNLSGGEMRRVALAGVLAMQPRVLVLDEPTAGLDPRGRASLVERIERLHRGGQTVVLVSHNMDEVARLATRIVVLHQGRICLQGAPREVFAGDGVVTSIGLGLPQATRLTRHLRERGIQVADALTLAEARGALVAAWRARRGGGPWGGRGGTQ